MLQKIRKVLYWIFNLKAWLLYINCIVVSSYRSAVVEYFAWGRWVADWNLTKGTIFVLYQDSLFCSHISTGLTQGKSAMTDKMLSGMQSISTSKVRKWAKIRNWYNQAPHLTQDTNVNLTTSQLDISNESQEVSHFLAGDHRASTNRHEWKPNKSREK